MPDGKSGVWEFKTWLRVAADSEEQARALAEAFASDVTEGPKDLQLTVEDDEPTFEEAA